MSSACYLTDLGEPVIGQLIKLTGAEGRHAVTVKRTRVGERLILSDGAGQAVAGEVVEVEKQGLLLRVDEIFSEPDSPHRWVVVQALAKGDRSDIAVEVLTELGVDEIIAWQARRCVVRWEQKADTKVARWRGIARESTKQSRRLRIPEISYAATSEVCARMADAAAVLIAHESASRHIAEVTLPDSGEIIIVIGPEGGISEEELDAFAAHGTPVRISDGVLRSSTAGAVALGQAKLLAQFLSRAS